MTPYATGERWALYRADYRETLAACEGAADLGDRDAAPDRGLDSVPWVEVAARIIRAREQQVPLFGT